MYRGKIMKKIPILLLLIVLLIGYEDWTHGYWYESVLREAGVSEHDYEVCMRWAFGDDYLSLKLQYADDRWNERHPDLFVMYDSDYLHKAIYKVGKAWITKKEQS